MGRPALPTLGQVLGRLPLPCLAPMALLVDLALDLLLRPSLRKAKAPQPRVTEPLLASSSLLLLQPAYCRPSVAVLELASYRTFHFDAADSRQLDILSWPTPSTFREPGFNRSGCFFYIYLKPPLLAFFKANPVVAQKDGLALLFIVNCLLFFRRALHKFHRAFHGYPSKRDGVLRQIPHFISLRIIPIFILFYYPLPLYEPGVAACSFDIFYNIFTIGKEIGDHFVEAGN
jgi:hypothetical protein